MNKKVTILINLLAVTMIEFSPATSLLVQAQESVASVQIIEAKKEQVANQDLERPDMYVAMGDSLEESDQNIIKAYFTIPQDFQAQIKVDGSMVNHYLGGTSSEDRVYSSVAVERMPIGYGVVAQIQTPSTLNKLTPVTYQNLAMTMGYTDVNIQLAASLDSSGEGAIAGLESLAKQLGISLQDEEVKAVQAELALIEQAGQFGLSEYEMNAYIVKVKEAIINGKDLRSLVDKDVKNEQAGLRENLLAYGNVFKQTKAAQRKEMGAQLAASIYPTWRMVLSGKVEEKSRATLLNEKIMPFDQLKLRPLIQEFIKTFYDLVSTGQGGDDVYSHTVVGEEVEQDLSADERRVLIQLRQAILQYAGGSNIQVKQNEWLNRLQAMSFVREADPFLFEMVHRVAAATGYAPEVYSYEGIYDQGGMVFNIYAPSGHYLLGQYRLDLGQDKVEKIEGDHVQALEKVYDFNQTYGWPVISKRRELPIESNYQPSERALNLLNQ